MSLPVPSFPRRLCPSVRPLPDPLPPPPPPPAFFSRRPRARAPHAAATLKFLAVLLAAGMLAFLGAIICIIASVHPAGSAAPAAAPPGADNDSAAAALLPAADKGLGALHGPAEALASAGPRLPGGPPPPPLFSRFVCTPLSAECPVTGPGTGPGPEELLALRSAAAQLRRTALEQKERIRMDQETIRELTGKLSRCEGGLRTAPPAAAAAVPPAGLRAAPRPGTMGHPPAEPPAVRELEEAVRALQDRIDRIEVRGMGRGGGGDAPGGKMLPGVGGCSRTCRAPALHPTPQTSSSPSRGFGKVVLAPLFLEVSAQGQGARPQPPPLPSMQGGPKGPGLSFPPPVCTQVGHRAHPVAPTKASTRAGRQLRAKSCPLAER